MGRRDRWRRRGMVGWRPRRDHDRSVRERHRHWGWPISRVVGGGPAPGLDRREPDPAERSALNRLFYRNRRQTWLGHWVIQLFCFWARHGLTPPAWDRWKSAIAHPAVESSAQVPPAAARRSAGAQVTQPAPRGRKLGGHARS